MQRKSNETIGQDFIGIDVLHEQNLIAAMEAVSYRKDHYFIELDEQN
ncbi:hypothetical protein ABKP09_06095 [Peribacillus frigoritolerans]|nr:hypothetical protein [Peribacillus frigoritolerans]MDF1996458.1 hypothetical protein [Peribacillus frigoritolerans]